VPRVRISFESPAPVYVWLQGPHPALTAELLGPIQSPDIRVFGKLITYYFAPHYSNSIFVVGSVQYLHMAPGQMFSPFASTLDPTVPPLYLKTKRLHDMRARASVARGTVKITQNARQIRARTIRGLHLLYH